MKKSILITRPRDQSQEISQYLNDNGFEVFVEPIFLVDKLPLPNDEFLQNLFSNNVEYIIITSGNAAQMALDVMEKLRLDKNIKIFAIGKRTARDFLLAGYDNVTYPNNNSAEDLMNLILQDSDIIQKKKSSLYFCGEVISLDFKEELAKYGVKLEKIISYRIIEEGSFSELFLQKIKQESFDFTLLYSRNSAKHFLGLLKKHNLFECFQSSQILCLSTKIMSFVNKSGFKNSKTFDEIAILKKFYE